MKIIIIGAGPAGIAAALAAKNQNNEVILIEKNPRIGKKLLVTGNGRCNYSNAFLSPENYNDPNFVKPLLEVFQTEDLIHFFQLMGLESTREGNRIYPVTLKANSVLTMLLLELERKGIEIKTQCRVSKIQKDRVFHLETNQGELWGDKLILATGGASMPSSGSDGKSWDLARSLGHQISKIHPALTQLKLDSPYLKHLSGVKVHGKAKLFSRGKYVDGKSGDLLFTDYGISGPPILDLSVHLARHDDPVLELPLINNFSKEMKENLFSRYYILSHFSLEDFLLGIVDKKFIYFILDRLHLKRQLPMSMVSIRDFEAIVQMLCHCTFPIVGTTGFKNSQVTRGGILTEEVCREDFSSKIVPGLYIVGEALNIDGVCGGYNLHFAFGSGIQAGKALQKLSLEVL